MALSQSGGVDPFGRSPGLNANGGKLTTSLSYGITGNQISWLGPTKATDTDFDGTVTDSFAYESLTGRLHGISAGSGLYAVTYTYNQNDQRQTDTVSQTNPDGSVSSSNFTYGYDALDELQSVTGTRTYGYTYDGVGNRTNTGFGVANSLNQYTSFSYDLRGNLTDDGVFTYAWDADGHMTVATAKDSTVQVKNQYDGQGRRVRKDVFHWDPTANNGQGGWALFSTRKFDYAGGQLVAEFDGNNQMLTGYTWIAGTLISATDYTGTVPKTYAVIADGSGNTVALVDPNTGAVAASYTYDPYGKLLTATGPAAGVCNILFGQGYTDRETGLILLDVRFYSPPQERFLSRDPSGESGGLNLYPYVGNDPINFNDPSGNAPQAEGPPVDLNDVPFYGPVSLSRNQLGILGHTVIQGYSRTNYYYIIGGKAYPAVFIQYKHMPDPTGAPQDHPWTPGAADSYERTLNAENAAWGVSFIGVRASVNEASTTVAWPSTQEDPVATDFLRRALSPAGRGAAYLAQASENVPIFGPIFSALYHEITGSFGELGGDAFQFAMDVWSTWDAAVFVKSLGTVAGAVLKAGVKGGASAAAGIIGAAVRTSSRAAQPGSLLKWIGDGSVIFRGRIVQITEDLTHLSNEELARIAETGRSPRNIDGEVIHIHHVGQTADGALWELAESSHLGTPELHPLGKTAGVGLTEEERIAFDEWRNAYWKERAAYEQQLRGLR